MNAEELNKIANDIAKGFSYTQLTKGLKIAVLNTRIDQLESQLEESEKDYTSLLEFLIEHDQYIPKCHEDNYSKVKIRTKTIRHGS